MSRRLALVPPLVLAAVAALQFGLAQATPLSPWKLGGFGMFSTSNHTGTRVLRVHVRTAEGRSVVAEGAGDLHVRTWPRRAALRAHAQQAACRAWTLVPLDSLATAALPAPAWQEVYASAFVRRQTDLAGVAVEASPGDARAEVLDAEASVVWVRYDVEAGAIAPVVIVSERAACDP